MSGLERRGASGAGLVVTHRGEGERGTRETRSCMGRVRNGAGVRERPARTLAGKLTSPMAEPARGGSP
jgi:hypothetical protein